MGILTGKRALVTGGARGIGLAIVERLAADGADVAFTYHSSASAANDLVARQQAHGGRCIAIQANAATAADAQRAVEEAVAGLGGLDIVVHNAGVANVGPLDTLSEDQIQEMLDVNIRAVVLGCRAAIAHLPDNGRIVMIGSALGERVFSEGLAPYAMTKAALGGLTRGLARELGPRGINVNMINVGSTYSDMNPRGNPREDYLRSLIAIGRFNESADVAAAVAFLASDDARQITGATLAVDGGMNA